jgi:preprotein translocase subunit SecY
LKKEGEAGRRKIGQYTRYGTVLLAIIQGTAIANYLSGATSESGVPLVASNYVGIIPFVPMTVLTLTAGSMFVVWLGEQITERGLGEGASVIIFAGIAAGIPQGTIGLWTMVTEGTISFLVGLIVVALMLLVIGLVIFLEMGQRRVPVHISQKGGRLMQQQQSYLPLKINMSGVIPPIFASALLLFPSTISNFVDVPWLNNIQEFLSPAGGLHNILFVGLIVFFCFFYTEIVFPPQDMADNLKKGGKFIPGIRAGKSTAEFIQKVINRITVAGAIYISLICVLPTILIDRMNVPFYFGGTSLLILVGVAINLIEKVNAFRYESMMKSAAAVRTRRRRVQF